MFLLVMLFAQETCLPRDVSPERCFYWCFFSPRDVSIGDILFLRDVSIDVLFLLRDVSIGDVLSMGNVSIGDVFCPRGVSPEI